MAASSAYFFSHLNQFKRPMKFPEWRAHGPRHAGWKIVAHDGQSDPPTIFYVKGGLLEEAVDLLLQADQDGRRFYYALDIYSPATDNWRGKYGSAGWTL